MFNFKALILPNSTGSFVVFGASSSQNHRETKYKYINTDTIVYIYRVLSQRPTLKIPC